MRELRTKTFRGAEFAFVATDHNASHFTFEDEEQVRERHWHIKPGEVVIDGGAGFGSYALAALALGAEHVHIFSPEKNDTDLLTANLEANPSFNGRAVVVPYGLHGVTGFFEPNACRFAANPEDAGTWIPVVSLDKYVFDLGCVSALDWIKLDVEGAEFDVLKGGVKTLTRFRPNLLIENHLFHRPSMLKDITDLLVGLNLGYEGETHPHHAVSHTFWTCR